MAEILTLDLNLRSNVSSVADKDAASLRRLSSQADRTQKSQLDKFGAALGRVGVKAETDRIRSLERQAKAEQRQQQKFADQWAKIGMAKARADKRHADERKREERENSLFGGIKEGFGLKGAVTGAFFGALAAESIIEGVHKAVEIFTEGIKSAFEGAAKEEKLRLAFRSILGPEGAKEYLEESGRLGKLAGYSKSETASQLQPLLGAGFRGERLTQAYALATDISARKGGGAENVNEAVDAIRKIELKGGISKKQLVGLGLEKNEDFFKSIAADLRVSTKEAEKMVEQGHADSQLIINHLSNLVNKQQGGPGGTGGSAYAKTFESRINRLKNLPEEFFREMVNNPGFQATSDKIEAILGKLDPESPDGQKILGALNAAFVKVGTAVEEALTPENITKFANAVTSLVSLVGTLVGQINNVADAVGTVWKYNPVTFLPRQIAKGYGAAADALTGKSGPQVLESKDTPLQLVQNNVFNGVKDAEDGMKRAGGGIVSELEKSRSQGAKPR